MIKTNNESIARAAAIALIEDEDLDAAQIVETFASAQFDRTCAKVAGSPVRMRRLILVGQWEVDPSQSAE